MLYSSTYRNLVLVFGSGQETKVIVNGALVAPRDIKELPISTLAICSAKSNVAFLEKHGVHAIHLDPNTTVRVRECFVNEGEDGVNPHFSLKDDEGVEVILGDDLAIVDALVEWCRHYRVDLDIRLHYLVAPARQRLAALKSQGKLDRFIPVHKVAERT